MSKTRTLYVYQMDECAWVIAHSAKEATKFYAGFIDALPEDCTPERRLTEEELRATTYVLDANSTSTFLEVRDAWVQEGNQVPFIFATTDY